MKRLALFVLAAVSASALAQFPSRGIRQLSQIPLSAFEGAPSTAANIYGFVSPGGREYATVGLRNGTAIVEITNPLLPSIVAHIPGPSSLWHENVVLGNYCYSIADSTGNGIQIIDLSNVDSGNAQLVGTYTGNGTANVHTIQADAQTNRLFQNGGTRNGCAILNASNPTALTEMGRWNTKYVHDCVVRNYTSGPYAGRQIVFLCCGSSGLYIADVTNPSNIVTLGSLNYYPGTANAGKFYCHSASITPDFKYLIVNDELDEFYNIAGGSMKTFVVDIQNLSAPTVAATFNSGVRSIDHNSQLLNGFLFLSAYQAGLRIYDARNPLALFESGWIDTHQTTPQGTWEGDWGVYAAFPSGVAAISDINQGLILADPSEAVGLGAPITGGTLTGVVGGTIADLKRSDDNRVRCSFSSAITVFAETTIAPRTNLAVTVEASGEGGTLSIRLRNQTTNAMDVVGTMIPNRVEGTLVIPNLPTGTYVTPSGAIEAQLIYSTTSKSGTRQPCRIDQVRFDVTP